MRRLPLAVALVCLVVGWTAACAEKGTSPTAPTTVQAALSEALSRAIQDEYRAGTMYQGVLNDFGLVLPFANIIFAEERHSAAIERLYSARAMPVPANGWTLEAVPHFTSVSAACAAGVAAERDNISMYDELLRTDLPTDVRQVFSNNRNASAENHLPAFERCS